MEKPNSVIEWKAVNKSKINKDNFVDNIQNWFKQFKWENNIHKIFWVVLLVIGLWQLRQWLIGLILIIFGILFVTGYFDKKIDK